MWQHLSNLADHYSRGGARGVGFWLSKQLHRNLAPTLSGRNIFEDDWDMLVVLDGCRPEWLNEVWTRSPVNSRYSVGSHSRDWLENTFRCEHADKIEKTAYVSANLHTEPVPQKQLAECRLLGQTHFVDELKTVPAHLITDHAIMWRELSRQIG